MAGFELSAGVNADNVFLVSYSELQGRLDPLFYNTVHGFSLTKTTYPVKKLSEVIDMQRGRFGHRPRNDPKFYDGQYPFIQTGDVVKASHTNEPIAYTQTLNELGLKTSRLFDKNVLVITIAANIGDTAILNYPACFPDSLIGITPKTDALTLSYLNVYFKFLKPYLNDLAPQSAQKNINYQQLSPVPIVMPPLAIQQKISGLFHQAHEQKQQKEQQAQALLDSIDDYLLNALGITLPQQDNGLEMRIFTVPFSEVVGRRLDVFYNSPKHTNKYESLKKSKFSLLKIRDISTSVLNGKEFREYSDAGYRYLRVSDLDKFDISNHNPRFIELSNFPESIRLSKSDILISRSGSLGLVSVVTDEILDSVLSSHIFKLSLDVKVVMPEYVEGYLRSTLGQFQFFQKNNGGIIPELNQSALKDISVIVPPLKKQTEIATHITQIRAQAKQLQAEAANVIATAKVEIERMILGESA
jgi:restriction endonuclease S subunit